MARPAAMERTIRAMRGGMALLLFAVFGIGASLLSPLMLLLRSPERCQPPVRATWRFFAWLCVKTGLIGIDTKGLGGLRGCILAPNHPSLLDVVLVTAIVPRTLFVAKHALRRNPFLSAIVRHVALPDDERLVEAAAPRLAAGWNVLVFPEGTRSPGPDAMGPLHRGVAQLALRTGAPLACIGIRLSHPILGKRQKPWDMGPRRTVYTFRSDHPSPALPSPARGLRPQAEALTDSIRRRIAALM